MGEKEGIEFSVDALVGTAKGSVNISGPSGSTGEGAQGFSGGLALIHAAAA